MIPVLPESAPFTPAQRGWLNGFLAGVFGIDRNGHHGAAPIPAPSTNGHAAEAKAAAEESFPWHDPSLSLDDRLKLAEGKPAERVFMAAMAQLDCGSCGYLCQTYAEAIARGEDKDLTKCSPGGKDTARKLKELVANRKSLPTIESNGTVVVVSQNGTLNCKPAATTGHGMPGPQPTSYSRKNPFPAPLIRSVPLTQPGSEKDVRFVAFNLKGSGLEYSVGDALGVFPENCPDLVESILATLGARGDELVTFPSGRFIHSFDALLREYSITKIGDQLIDLLASRATAPSDENALRALLQDDPDGVAESSDVLDLLQRFPSARPTVLELINSLSPLQPRLYSISSSLKAHPDEVHLTIGVVRYSRHERLRKGVASTFMTELLRPRQKANVFVHHSPGFRLPTDNHAPVIMIGPGTGIAPFRAFLEERAAVGAKGKNWLFFGDQRRSFDFLYREEMEQYQKGGLLNRLDLAFSRDQAEKVYVQHRMKEQAGTLWAWLQEGAHFYVCGDARRMALDVDNALHSIVAEQGSMSGEAAKDYVKELTKSKRYQRDVY